MASPAQSKIIREIQRLYTRRAPLNIPAVKRSHPKLIEQVYAVRPFWGWKRALEDAGLAYDKIDIELLDYVDCKICGRDFGALDVHLLRKHDVTAEDYRGEYPGAETTCERLRAAIAEHRLKKRTPLPRWEVVWTPEYVLDRMAEMRRRGFPLNCYWASNHDQALSIRAREYFGSWDEALQRIGLEPEKIRLAKPTEHLTRKELIARLKKSREDGRGHIRPREKDDSALANAARKYFGSWNAALRAAGIEPLKETSRWAKANKAEILAEIRRRKHASESLRSAPEVGEKWGRALRMRVEKLFGSWNKALRKAGIEPKKENSPWGKASKTAILKEIRRRKHAGESLATRKVERSKWGTPLINRAKVLFGSWASALLAAGVDLPAGLMSPWAQADKTVILAEIRGRKRAGESLSYSKVAHEPWGTPLLKRAEILFGTWSTALVVAGVDLPAGAFSPWPGADKADILAEIRRRQGSGESWRYDKVQAEPWGRPLLRRAKTLFGGWNTALRAAGIEPVKENSPWPRASKTALLAEVHRRERAGQPLSSSKVQKEKWGKPLVRRANMLFGSWHATLLAAGVSRLDLPERSRWSTADRASVLAEIGRRNAGCESLRSGEVERGKGGAPLLRRARTLFASWKAALRAAGINPTRCGRSTR